MGLLRKVKDSLASVVNEAELRARERDEAREKALRAELVAGEEIEAFLACRTYDSVGEWVALTTKRVIVTNGKGQEKRSIPYSTIATVRRRANDLKLEVSGASQDLYLKAGDVDDVQRRIVSRTL